MQIRLECYDHERDDAVAALREGFRVKSVSKAYPNMRQTGTQGTPCESRYYVTMEGKDPVRSCGSMRDMLALDLLRFLAIVSDGLGMDLSGEVANIRRFYDSCAGMPASQAAELALAFKSGLCARAFGAMRRKGGTAT